MINLLYFIFNTFLKADVTGDTRSLLILTCQPYFSMQFYVVILSGYFYCPEIRSGHHYIYISNSLGNPTSYFGKQLSLLIVLSSLIHSFNVYIDLSSPLSQARLLPDSDNMSNTVDVL